MAQTNQKLSREALKKAAFRHNWTLQWCWNYERMQASGFAYSMIPILNELYSSEEEVCENLERHMQFYNSHPGTSAIIFGASAALEEGYQKDMSNSIKTALMGPLGGIGDTLQFSLVQPFAYLISAALAAGPFPGNLFSIPLLLIPFVLFFWARWPFFWWGYKQSSKIIEKVGGQNKFNLLRNAAQIMGLTVIGGFIPAMLKIIKFDVSWMPLVEGEKVDAFNLQNLLDSLLPHLLPIALVVFCYWMLKTCRLTPVRAILILAVITFLLGISGVLTIPIVS
jgi:PTS system mannose-specific IID component